MNKAGRQFFVTGVSQGLGHAMFARLIAAGTRPVGIGRSFTADQRREEAAGSCRLLSSDMTKPEVIRDLPLTLPVGTTEIVFISNAGTVAPVGAIGEREPADVVASALVNFLAPALLSDRLAALARQSGVMLTVLNISSGAGRRAIAGWSAYCAAKAGASMFFACLAAENPDWNIRDIDPGVMDTGMQAQIRDAAFPAVDDFRRLQHEGKLRRPGDVAGEILAAFLS